MTDMRTPPWPVDSGYLRTGDLLVDLCFRRITSEDGDVELPQRLFDLLLLLMAEPHTLHSRSELFARLWPGVIVEDANLSQSMWLLRKALGYRRKHWIHTVAKGGYVFEPPGPVEWFVEPPAFDTVPVVESPRPERVTGEPVRADSQTTGHDAELEGAPPATLRLRQKPLWLRPRSWAFVAIVGAAVAILAVWYSGEKSEVHQTPPQPLTVALIELEDRANTMRWPAKLSREWLGWKLGSLPEVTLLTEADLAVAGASAKSPQVVFLTAGAAANDPSQVVLRARFQNKRREQRIEFQGPVSQVPDMVDKLSQKVMDQLVPARAKGWPPLVVSADAARRYTDAVDAIDRRDWMTAAAISNEVVKRAPRFGLARMRLARAQSRLAQGTSAVEQMDAAIELMQPAPAEVTELMRMQALAIDPQRDREATEAFAKLSARYPDKAIYTLQYAQLLSQTGELKQALKILSSPDWDRQSMGMRIARLLALTDVHLLLGDPERMRQNARAAEHMTREAGAGWELEHGSALLQIAIADTAQGHADINQYEQAAKELEKAGNLTGALYARFLAETVAPPVGASSSRMETLLAQARAGGYRRLEIDILGRVAAQHYEAGDLIGYRQRLEEALVASRDSRDALLGNRLALALVAEDIVGARFDAAEELLRPLRQAKLQGRWGVHLAHFDAALQAIHGHHLHAIAILDRAERDLIPPQAGSAVSEPASHFACVRADGRLPLGDLAGARADWRRCALSAQEFNQVTALTGRAMTELLAGDREAARNLIRQAQTVQDPAGTPTSWEAAVSIATVLTRIGSTSESDRLYSKALPSLRAAGYDWLAANAETGLAENAAARGDWATSQRHNANARRDVPADAWLPISRLEILDIAAALAKGDRERAISLATRLHATAQRLGDQLTLMEVHSLLPQVSLGAECPPGHRDTMVARSGMRGATLDWLSPVSARAQAQPAARAK